LVWGACQTWKRRGHPTTAGRVEPLAGDGSSNIGEVVSTCIHTHLTSVCSVYRRQGSGPWVRFVQFLDLNAAKNFRPARQRRIFFLRTQVGTYLCGRHEIEGWVVGKETLLVDPLGIHSIRAKAPSSIRRIKNLKSNIETWISSLRV
jgi:hypothetical protein